MNKQLLWKWYAVKRGYRMLFTEKEVELLDSSSTDIAWADIDYTLFLTDESRWFPGLFVGYIDGHPDPKIMGIGGEL